MAANATNDHGPCSPWCCRCVAHPHMIIVRWDCMRRTIALIVSAGMPLMPDAHSAVFGCPSLVPSR